MTIYIVTFIAVALYWLVFAGNENRMLSTPFGWPIQMLTEWTATDPPNDVWHYHRFRAFLLNVAIVWVIVAVTR